ncbi:MAG: hypothetical protein Ct9H300mP19_09070 [Dehalococcoidia bacterium]|nr:MAG: hypothetical protein Ct9H300mP19_09070 [Dehalococcoidia bacterium]
MLRLPPIPRKVSPWYSRRPLTATVLATEAPVINAPAMDADMFASPSTQRNVNTLVKMER